MGGHFAGTIAGAADAFDPRKVTPGDVLWSIFWNSDDLPELWTITAETVEQVGWYKDFFSGFTEEKWMLASVDKKWAHEYSIIIVNGWRQCTSALHSWSPFFWRSREETERAARDGMRETIKGIQDEMRRYSKDDRDYYKERIAKLKAALPAPIPERKP